MGPSAANRPPLRGLAGGAVVWWTSQPLAHPLRAPLPALPARFRLGGECRGCCVPSAASHQYNEAKSWFFPRSASRHIADPTRWWANAYIVCNQPSTQVRLPLPLSNEPPQPMCGPLAPPCSFVLVCTWPNIYGWAQILEYQVLRGHSARWRSESCVRVCVQCSRERPLPCTRLHLCAPVPPPAVPPPATCAAGVGRRLPVRASGHAGGDLCRAHRAGRGVLPEQARPAAAQGRPHRAVRLSV
jgi:hypothetical protein